MYKRQILNVWSLEGGKGTGIKFVKIVHVYDFARKRWETDFSFMWLPKTVYSACNVFVCLVYNKKQPVLCISEGTNLRLTRRQGKGESRSQTDVYKRQVSGIYTTIYWLTTLGSIKQTNYFIIVHIIFILFFLLKKLWKQSQV